MFRSVYKILDILLNIKDKSKTTKEGFEDQINYIEKYCPLFLEELRGLSDITNIKIESLLTLMNFLRYKLGGYCTTTLSTGSATKNNQTFLTDNFDWIRKGIGDLIRLFLLRQISRKLWVKKYWSEVYPLSYKYVYWGIPIIYEWPLMNEKGLGFGATGTLVTKNDSRYIDIGPGINIDMLRSFAMMRCSNVSEVARLYKSVERMSDVYGGYLINDMATWCDKEGGILMIEESHNNILTVFGNSTEITSAS